MAETARTYAQLLALFPDNSTGAISPQDLRDFVHSMLDAHGQIYLSTPITTTITTQNVFVKAAGTTLLEASAYEVTMPVDNRLQYSGSIARHGRVSCSFSFKNVASNRIELKAKFYKNGVAVDPTEMVCDTAPTAGVRRTMNIQGHFDVNPGDYVELWIANGTNTDNITIDNLQMGAFSFFGT